jgi:hypothetical protein
MAIQEQDTNKAQKAQEVKKQQARSLFGKALQQVEEFAELTRTVGWKHIYQRLLNQERRANEAWRDCKSSDLPTLQGAAKARLELCAPIKEAIQNLHDVVRDYPIFAAEVTVDAKWDEDTGEVEIMHMQPISREVQAYVEESAAEDEGATGTE